MRGQLLLSLSTVTLMLAIECQIPAHAQTEGDDKQSSQTAPTVKQPNEVFEESAFNVVLTSGFGWPDGRLTRTGISPDALFLERMGDDTRQIKAGRCTFVETLVPIEFAAWISPAGHELVVANADHSVTIEDCLGHFVWIEGGLPQADIGRVEIEQIELAGENWRKSWEAVLREPGVSTVKSKEILRLRVAFVLNEDEVEQAFGGHSEVDMRLGIYIDPTKIEGNGDLANALEKKHGREPHLYFHSVPFTVVKKSEFDKSDEMKTAYAHWRLRKARGDNPERWEAFDKLLEMQPNNESEMLEYARSLERGGQHEKANAIVGRLIETIKKRPDTIHQLNAVDPFQLVTPFVEHAGEQHGEMAPGDLVRILKRHQTRLRGAAEDTREGGEE